MPCVILFLALTAACWTGPYPANPVCRRGELAVIHSAGRCGDLRNGYSGYDLFRVETGPHPGALAYAMFGEGVRTQSPGDGWHVAILSWSDALSSPSTGWDNACAQLGHGPIVRGAVESARSYPSEAAAYRAWREQCD